MRVISGKARGTSLISPSGIKTRPTGDRMKEDLFNILVASYGSLQDLLFLDLYCGSGAIGIEALSRGAGYAVFVDESKEAIEATANNLQKTKLDTKPDSEDVTELLHMPADKAIALCRARGQKFDIIFLDPPYDVGDEVLGGVLAEVAPLLMADGIVVAECPGNITNENWAVPDGLTIFRQKRYAQMQFIFLRKKLREND